MWWFAVTLYWKKHPVPLLFKRESFLTCLVAHSEIRTFHFGCNWISYAYASHSSSTLRLGVPFLISWDPHRLGESVLCLWSRRGLLEVTAVTHAGWILDLLCKSAHCGDIGPDPEALPHPGSAGFLTTSPSLSFLTHFSSAQFSRSVVSNSLRIHESQHTRPLGPSPTPRVHPDSRPSSQWCHPAISSSVIPFSSCPNPSQHQSLFQWVSSSHELAKVLEFQL